MDLVQDRSQNSNEPERAQKRRKVDNNSTPANNDANGNNPRKGMGKPISPPPLRRLRKESSNQRVQDLEEVECLPQMAADQKNTVVENPKQKVVKSPFQLTSIRNLPASSNVDAVSLKDILGDPLISECWEFNYLHDLDFLMEQFDEDVRHLVKVNVVHGFWKREDQSRLNLMEQALKYPNINLLTAYMPEMFGTHHSKMLILLRHDSTAQVIIHTANMIPFDWANMTQAMWKSPLLPLLNPEKSNPVESTHIGSGSKFKLDLLNYLRAYDTKRIICKPLIEQLLTYDFSEIRAALVASVPGRQDIEIDTSKTAWGWAGLKNVLKSVPVGKTQPDIVVQISSIASLGPTDKWLNQTFFKALSTSKTRITSRPNFKIIFPTADEIRNSINGYASGNAIHTKILTPAQGKQLAYLKSMLCYWDAPGTSPNPELKPLSALRNRAAPHIKTYIRFSDQANPSKSIDWMLVTSANLSKQAWGETLNAAGEVRICSYEIGVLVWPGLWGEGAKMVPTFGSDVPSFISGSGAGDGEVDGGDKDGETTDGETTDGDNKDRKAKEGKKTQEYQDEISVGARMPYDLPIIHYSKEDIPWCATASYAEPDWLGNTWQN